MSSDTAPPRSTIRDVLAATAAAGLSVAAMSGAAGQSPGPAAETGGSSAEIRGVHDALGDPSVDSTRIAPVSGLRIERDVGRLHLEEGTLALLEPVAGREAGAVFVGRATFSFRPPDEVERRQLERHFESDSLAVPVRAVALLATDSLHRELRRSLDFAPGAVPEEAREAVGRMVDAVEWDGDVIGPSVLSAFVRAPSRPYFRAHLVPREGDDFAFTVDARRREEVGLGLDVRGDGRFETVCRFHRRSDYEEMDAVARAREEAGHALAVRRYEIDVSLDRNQTIDADAILDVAPRDGAGSWVPFTLHPALRVDSARWVGGEAAEAHRFGDSRWLWVRLPPDAGDPAGTRGEGDPLRLRLRYRGDVVSYRRGWFFLESPTGWYPRHGESYSAFELTFSTPDDFPVVSVGEKVSEREEAGRITTRWRTRRPAYHASFAVGRLVKHEIRNPVVQPVDVYVDLEAHRNLQRDTGGQLWRRDNMDELVGGDLVNALGIFEQWFGPVGDRALRVAEIPYGHGQAFPGLIHMSWITFQRMSQDDLDEMFRAHEVAHQWWGLEVRPRTYHDAWLAEGMAEYASLLYLGSVTRDTAAYMEQLRETKEEILDRRGDAGPVWLGTRLGRGEHPEDYSTIVYGKGAWVVHMLWGLLLEDETMDISRFRTMLRDLYARYRGEELSTAEFREHVERHAGRDLGWFFDQWVRGTDVPTYRVSYRGEELDDGRFGMEIRVLQEDVPPDFRMEVPISLRLGEDGWKRLRIEVTGRETSVRLDPLAEKPDRVVFNAFEAVLADVDVEGWEEG